MKKILFIVGTRPEAIKLAPVIKELQEHKDHFRVQVLATAQHREMLDEVLKVFDIKPDFDLDVMTQNQGLAELSSLILDRMEGVFLENKPDMIIVQGDTTTAFMSALLAFYHKIKVAHVEAGLRTGDKKNPFPEEVNRKLLSVVADLNFAPTEISQRNLIAEGVRSEKVWITGNTIVDSVNFMLDDAGDFENEILKKHDFTSKRTVLVTVHRRENFGQPLQGICAALKEIVKQNSDVEIIYPVHPNPNVRDVVFSVLDKVEGIKLIDPLVYPDFIKLMAKSVFVLTDSGGVQEEAPSVGKKALVLRKITERPEGIEGGFIKVIGVEENEVVRQSQLLLKDKSILTKRAENPYGDGTASKRIAEILKTELFDKKM